MQSTSNVQFEIAKILGFSRFQIMKNTNNERHNPASGYQKFITYTCQ
jgi:hypothetical protein